jgi:hypothetical protein
MLPEGDDDEKRTGSDEKTGDGDRVGDPHTPLP